VGEKKMPKELRIVLSDEEYERLKTVKGNRSWKEFLMGQAEVDAKTRLAYEITNGFNELKARVAGTMQNGALTGILEVFRVICIKLAKMEPEDRKIAVEKVRESLMTILESL